MDPKDIAKYDPYFGSSFAVAYDMVWNFASPYYPDIVLGKHTPKTYGAEVMNGEKNYCE